MAKHRELSLSNAETPLSPSTAQPAALSFGLTDSQERDFKQCQNWLDLVSYKDWHLEMIRPSVFEPSGRYLGMLTTKFMAINTYHPMERIPVEARHLVPGWIRDNQREFYAFVRNCIEAVEMHELDEWFRVGGRLVKNPHDEHDPEVWEPGNELGIQPIEDEAYEFRREFLNRAP